MKQAQILPKIKCEICGKFRKKEDLTLREKVCGNGFELDQYLECRFCIKEIKLSKEKETK